MRQRKLKFLAGATLAAVLGLGAWAITPALAVHLTTIFELRDVDENAGTPDANAEDGDGDGDDWSNMNDPDPSRTYVPADDHSIVSTGIIHDEGNANANHPDVFAPIPGGANLKPEDIFTGGGTKDINDLNQWKWKNASGFPDKNDITHAYASAYICDEDAPANNINCIDGDLILYFGADRFTNNGDAFLGFWFFQQGITEVAGSPAGTFSGLHTAHVDSTHPGDFLILVDYPQASNAIPILRVLEWVNSGGSITTHLDEIFNSTDPTATNARCGDDPVDDPVCASTNDASTPSPWFYAFKGTTADDNFRPQTFYEGGINISELLGDAQLCLSAFMVETRASESETATLKDFVLGKFNLCSTEVTTEVHDAGDNDITNTSVSPSTVIHDNALITGVAPGSILDPTGTVDFQLFNTDDCTGTPTNTYSNIPVINDSVDDLMVEAETPTVTGLNPGDYSYLAHYDGDNNFPAADGSCEPFTIAAQLKVVKQVVNQCVGDALDPGRFDLYINGVLKKTAAGDGGNTGFVDAGANPNSFHELGNGSTNLANYVKAISGGTNCLEGNTADDGAGTINVTGNSTCTITNTAKASVTVTKVLIGTPSDTGVFDLKVDATTVAGNVGDGGSGTLVLSGPFPQSTSVSEAAGTGTNLARYNESITCDNGYSANNAGPLGFSVTSGEHVQCTIYNIAVLPATSCPIP